ncbi:hypothetical protein GDO81_018977 [Engystomops pustulosus]|uniref:Uncharacterized protein n=1 Tax=Engystomops pustulosus TaxID=76066 RepID=A0AAV6YCU1_ENGPU|nr:hypothetical protein GDO81_018977 [Engystomops pustulosus]
MQSLPQLWHVFPSNLLRPGGLLDTILQFESLILLLASPEPRLHLLLSAPPCCNDVIIIHVFCFFFGLSVPRPSSSRAATF